MKTLIPLALLIIIVMAFSTLAHADLLCGLYRISVGQNELTVNDKEYAYTTSVLGKNGDYLHEFAEGNQLRVTQKRRVAYRQVNKTRWNSCRPLVYYQENLKSGVGK